MPKGKRLCETCRAINRRQTKRGYMRSYMEQRRSAVSEPISDIRATVHEWMKDGDFRAEVGRQRDAVTQEAFGMLASNLTRAVEVLAGLLNDGDKRLKRFAANDILNHFARHKELNELTERIEAIEQALAKRG